MQDLAPPEVYVSKRGGQTCPTKSALPRSILELISSKAAKKLHGQCPLLGIINPAISDAAHRLKDLLSVPGFGSGESVISVREIGVAMKWSERKVKYCISQLVNTGAVEVSREPNKPNTYRIKSAVFETLRQQTSTERVMKSRPVLRPCCKCRRPCVPNKAGWCRKCTGDMELSGKIRHEVGRTLSERGIA